MKNIASLLAFVLSTVSCLSHEFGDPDGLKTPVRTEPVGPLQQITIPICERAKEALGIVVKHHECTVEEFFQMSGLNIPTGGSFALDEEGSNIVATLDRSNAEFVVMLVGDMILFCARPKWVAAPTREEILDRYAWRGEKLPGWFPEWWRAPRPEPRGEPDGAE